MFHNFASIKNIKTLPQRHFGNPVLLIQLVSDWFHNRLNQMWEFAAYVINTKLHGLTFGFWTFGVSNKYVINCSVENPVVRSGLFAWPVIMLVAVCLRNESQPPLLQRADHLFVQSYYIKHIMCPNQAKFHTALPWAFNNAHAKCEVERMRYEDVCKPETDRPLQSL